MNKKLKSIISCGAVTILTASSMLPIHALSKTYIKKTTIHRAVYIYVNGVKFKLPLNPICPNIPSKPEVKPNIPCVKPDVKPDNKPSNPTTKPEVKPDNKPSTPVTKPEVKPDNKPSTPATKPEVKPDNKPSTDFSSYQRQVLDLVNAERSKRGIAPLTLDSNLSSVATKKSQDMINKNYFDHTSPTYGSPFNMMNQFGISYRSAGENIAKGQRTPQDVVTAWMNSEGHRKNILNSSYTNLGVGVAKDSNGTIYWTQMFIGK